MVKSQWRFLKTWCLLNMLFFAPAFVFQLNIVVSLTFTFSAFGSGENATFK